MCKLARSGALSMLVALGCEKPAERPPSHGIPAPAPEPTPTAQPSPTSEPAATVEPTPTSMPSATVSAPAQASGTATAREAQVRCFCMSWVHRDENGELCYPTLAQCDEQFRTFGRHDKIACRASMRAECSSFACRDLGKTCVRK